MSTERRIRKGDRVRLKPKVFLTQIDTEEARVLYVYRGMAHLHPTLNYHSAIEVFHLERVKKRRERP